MIDTFLYFQLFFSFLQVGMFSIGGGYAAIPLIQNEAVIHHQWLTLKEFTDLITIAEMTPGPIAVNSATFVGIKIAAEDDQFAYRYDTQLLIDRRDEDLDEDAIADYITEHFEGNSLIAAGDEDLIKIHFHTNEPWKILEYCNTLGEIYDIVVEDMIRQANGMQG